MTGLGGNGGEHVDNLTKSIIKINNSFKIIKNKVHKNNKFILYNAYIYSKILYGIEVYGRANQTTINKVQIQQNRSLKILYNKDFYTPTKQLHKDLNVLLVKDIFKLSNAKFVYKYRKDLLPPVFNNLFIDNRCMYKYNTRQCNNIHLTKANGKYGDLKIAHQGATIWNSLPLKIRNLKSIKNFSKKVKKIILESY